LFGKTYYPNQNKHTMFVASLNLDLFFKKVFSSKRIAKKFLEDLLNVTITDIKMLTIENKLTDDAVSVKFDFRCKIRGQYVVIEMQQKYKVDVIKRFYMYHAVSTALQLETLKPVKVFKPNGETYTEKNYSGLEPVITLIWMVDDMLGFDDDIIVYTTLPEATKDFISDKKLWQQSFEKIEAERKKVLKIIENEAKGLDFFAQNKLIYIFQKNIIRNKRINLPYYKWFDFANMSRNVNNTEEDFIHLKNDKDMAEVINRLRKDNLSSEEFNYVSDHMSWEILFERMRTDHKTEVRRLKKLEEKYKKAEIKAEQEKIKAEQEKVKAEQEKIKAEQEKVKAEQEKIKAEQEKNKAEQEKNKAEQEKNKAEQEKNKVEHEKNLLQLKLIKSLLQQSVPITSIAEILGIGIDETTALIKQI
jgi:hypothetical protein